jgi:GTP 3',8-cyclase
VEAATVIYSPRVISEKTPLSLRVSVTDLCRLKCLYCRPDGEDVPCERTDYLSAGEIMRFVTFLNREYGLSKVHITGGEPLERDDLPELIAHITAENIADIALTTNAQRLYEHAGALKRAGLKRINVSLDSLDHETTRVLTGYGDLDRTLRGIAAALDNGIGTVKINMVVLRGVNDNEIADIARFGMKRGCPVRFLELMPIGIPDTAFRKWHVPSAEVRDRLSAQFDLHETESMPGSSSRNYAARDKQGRSGLIGFISPYSAPFCGDCRRIRLTSEGRIIGCLARRDNADIRHILNAEEASGEALLRDAVDSALLHKRSGTELSKGFVTVEKMVRIGG